MKRINDIFVCDLHHGLFNRRSTIRCIRLYMLSLFAFRKNRYHKSHAYYLQYLSQSSNTATVHYDFLSSMADHHVERLARYEQKSAEGPVRRLLHWMFPKS